MIREAFSLVTHAPGHLLRAELHFLSSATAQKRARFCKRLSRSDSLLRENNLEPHLSKQLHELGVLIAVHLNLVDQLRLQLARGGKGAEELAPPLDLNVEEVN
jgi:hypothetical protein